MITNQVWITPRDVEELREAVLWAGGLSDVQRSTLRAMLSKWCDMERDLREAAEIMRELHALAHPQRVSQGG